MFITDGNTNWDNSYGFITSYTETDPVFIASDAFAITSTDISNWDTAYGWGDHSLAGYFVKAADTLDDISAGATNVHLTTSLKSNYDTAYSHSQAATNVHGLTFTAEGTGGGLDADLLDGQHGSYYSTAGNLSGTIPAAVLGNSTLYIGTTAIALNRASAVLALTGITSIDGNAGTVTNGVYTTGSYANPAWITAIPYSILSGTVPTWNQNTTGTAAGLSATLVVGSGGTGTTSFTSNGILYGNTTGVIQATAAGTNNYLLYSNSGTPAWTNAPAILGTNITGIPNGALANSSLTIGSTAISLGGTATTLAGLTSVTSTGFTGALTGNASTVTNGVYTNAANLFTNNQTITKITEQLRLAYDVSNYNTFTVGSDGNMSIARNGGAATFTLSANDRVGIGTTSPTYLLHLESATTPKIAIKNTANDTAGIHIAHDTAGTAQWATIGYEATSDVLKINNSGSFSSTHLAIDSSGNVGIGTTSPGYKLDVQGGDINASGNLREAGATLAGKYAYVGGSNASGSWPIGITGNATTATTATNVAWTGVTGARKPADYASSGGVLNFNPRCDDSNYWSNVTAITGGVVSNYAVTGSNGEHLAEQKTFPFDTTRRYRISGLIRKTAAVTSGTVYMGIQNYDINETAHYDWGGYVSWSMAATSLSTSFTRYSFELAENSQNVGTVRAAAHIILGYPNTGGGRVEFQDVKIEEITYSGTAGTVTTAAQPNITSVGTLTSLNVSGNVGIGTTSPTTTLQVSAPAGFTNWAGYFEGGTTTGNSWGLLVDAGTNSSDAAFQIRKSDNTNIMYVRGDGNVGIGTTSPGYKLTVNGQPGANGYTAFTNYSDSRLKENVALLSDGYMDKIMQLKPSTFNYNSLTGYDEATRQRRITGFIAQQLQTVFPEMVGHVKINGTDYLDTNLSALPLYLVKGMQEQQASIAGISNDQLSISNEFSITTDQVSDLVLKTDKNINTIEELQKSVDEQLAAISGQLTSDNKQLTDLKSQMSNVNGQISQLESNVNGQMSMVSGRIKSIEDLTITLQAQIDELKKLANQELNLAQIEASKNDIDYIKMVLGFDRAENGSIHLLGNLEADEIVAGVFTVKVADEEKKTIGTATIKEGENFVEVKTKAVSSGSKIFVTISQADKAIPIKTGDIKEGESFRVEINDPATSEIKFDWWIVEEK